MPYPLVWLVKIMKKGMGPHVKAFLLLLDEMLVAGLIVFVLWRIGVTIPLWVLAPGTVFFAALYFLSYRLISAQDREGPSGQRDLVGLKCRVVKPLGPEGMVRVRGELWRAVSQDGDVMAGTEVVVVRLQGLRLVVSPQRVRIPNADAETGEEPA